MKTLSVADAARLLDLSTREVLRRINEGELAAVRMGGRIRVVDGMEFRPR